MADEKFKLSKEDYRLALVHLTQARKAKGFTKAECIWLSEEACKLDEEQGHPEKMRNEAKTMRLQVIDEVYGEDETTTVKA
jgi:hypothetical protein